MLVFSVKVCVLVIIALFFYILFSTVHLSGQPELLLLILYLDLVCWL